MIDGAAAGGRPVHVDDPPALHLGAGPSPVAALTRGTRGRSLSAVATVAALAILAGALWQLDWGTFRSLATTDAWLLVALAAVLHLLTVPLKAAAWLVTLRGVVEGGRRLPITVVLSPVMVGALVNIVLAGRLGDAARVLLAGSRLQAIGRPAPVPVVLGSAVTESLVSTATWVGLVGLAGLFLPLPPAVWIAIAVFGGLWSLLVVASVRGWAAGPGRTGGDGPVGRVRVGLRRLWTSVTDGHRSLSRADQLVPLVVLSVGGWAAQLVSTYVLLQAFGIDGGWAAATLVLVSVSVAQTLPLLPGNVGVFQAAVALPLVASFGVPAATALAVGVVMQLVQSAPVAVAGAVALSREGEGIGHLSRKARALASSRKAARA